MTPPDLSIRTYWVLKNMNLLDEEGFIKIEECEKLTEKQFLSQPMFGRKSLGELRTYVSMKEEYKEFRENQIEVPSAALQRKIDIYKLRQTGLTLKEVGKQFGIGGSRVSVICELVERLLKRPHLRIVGLHEMEVENDPAL